MSIPPPDHPEPHQVLDLALHAGEVLLAGGASASSVTETCTHMARAGGLHRVSSDITFTSLTMSAHTAPNEIIPISGLRLVLQQALDYSRVTAVHNLVTDFVEGRIDRPRAQTRLDEIVAARHPYRRPLVALARATLATAVAVLLGGGLIVAAAAFASTVLIDLALGALHRAGLPAFFQNAVGGAIATITALALVWAELGVLPSLVVAGGIVLLLPGVTLVGAVQDAITGFYVTAAARIFETFLLTAGIISGVAATLSVAVRLGLPVQIGDPPLRGLEQVPLQLLAAAVVSTAFAVANYAPRRTLPAAALAGALGWGMFSLVGWAGLPTSFAAATAAAVVGVGAYLLAGLQRVPALVYAASGIIPLLPGLAIYRALRRFADGDELGGMSTLAQAITTGLALAAGVILGSFLARGLRRTDTRLVRRLAGLRLAGGPRRRPRPSGSELM